ADNGRLDRLNPNFTTMYLLTNLGERRYHGLVAGVTKRFSGGWQLSASYTYNHGRNNCCNPGAGGLNNVAGSGLNDYRSQ
ncbi:MAG: hypothetical protein L0387_31840, partial [Acidobacteria bacterium]|nr:hypothetical protein [Acidobacteriota bacterium]MCI0719014.1 hypothetical protein [Acidobacteriota bacterium]